MKNNYLRIMRQPIGLFSFRLFGYGVWISATESVPLFPWRFKIKPIFAVYGYTFALVGRHKPKTEEEFWKEI